ncbi:MAG: DUF4276 family protein [Deltaproteobacteria bacterium]|nr:DUF4276 family protein [Deltaproteobacteria bacterium]
MSRSLGILAEDATDIDVLKVIANRYKPGAFSFKVHHGRGAGELHRKGSRWIADLQRRDVRHVVILHDLDRDRGSGELHDESDLRHRLRRVVADATLEHLLCIPVEELEAWFWSCPDVLAKVAGRPQRAHRNPHAIRGPKEQLVALSRRGGRRPHYSTNDNRELAGLLDLERAARACPALRELLAFLDLAGE